jgi:hypothetical protein
MPQEGTSAWFKENKGDGWNINVGSGTLNIQPSSDPRAVALEQVNQLVSRLLAGSDKLSPEDSEKLAGGAVTLKNEVRSPNPDKGRIRAALDRVLGAAARVPELFELSRQLDDLVRQLGH